MYVCMYTYSVTILMYISNLINIAHIIAMYTDVQYVVNIFYK